MFIVLPKSPICPFRQQHKKNRGGNRGKDEHRQQVPEHNQPDGENGDGHRHAQRHRLGSHVQAVLLLAAPMIDILHNIHHFE